MSDTVEGRWFAWERGLKGLIPVVYHDGYVKSHEKNIHWKIRITTEEAQLSIAQLVSRYPLKVTTTGETRDVSND